MSLSYFRSDRFSARAIAMVAIACASTPSFAWVPYVVKIDLTPKKSVVEKINDVRLLSSKEMRTLKGKAGELPWIAGSNKCSPQYRGVDLITLNFSTSFTDLAFEGGYGIPVNVTRSYSVNNPETGPFGKGWTMSVDMRSTAGGILKSSSAPVRAVPVEYVERAPLQDDPNLATEPVDGVVARDANGTVQTIQRDLDGVLTTPAWDANSSVSEYETIEIEVEGVKKLYSVAKKVTTTTPDGTVYVYEKLGRYPQGAKAWGNPTAPTKPSNVLKIKTVTDRHGNVTTYNYDTINPPAIFQKMNGQVEEARLTSITMPGNRTITFNWTQTGPPRVASITDGTRTVNYVYNAGGLLTQVTTPAGLSTSFKYGEAFNTYNSTYGEKATDLLTEIVDPRGLKTSIFYQMMARCQLVTSDVEAWGVQTLVIVHPNNVWTCFYAPFDEFESHSRWTLSDEEYENWSGLAVQKARTFADLAPSKTLHDALLNGGIGNGLRGRALHLGAAYAKRVTSNNQPYIDVVTLDILGERPIQAPGEAYGVPITSYRRYHGDTLNLVEEWHLTRPHAMGKPNGQVLDPRFDQLRKLDFTTFGLHKQSKTYKYNFLGKPLEVTSNEYNFWPLNNPIQTLTFNATTQYAYWGKDKYYQQKAIKDTAGRISFTDYYSSTDTSFGAAKGQVKRVYDSKYSGGYSNTGGDDWRKVITPAYPNQYSAEMKYDDRGRPTEVFKLRDTSTSPWTYIKTRTIYNDDTGWAGLPQYVIEDDGGPTSRTTETKNYNRQGKPTETVDAAGRRFQTSYDADGKTEWVKRVDVNPHKPIVTYKYGTLGVNNGMVVEVLDGQSNQKQVIAYRNDPYSEDLNGQPFERGKNGHGQVESVKHYRGSSMTPVHTATYTYDNGGDRATVEHKVQGRSEDTKWRYADWIAVGSPESPNRVFQTLVKLDGNNVRTAEEFHYHFDRSGRLMHATFGMVPIRNMGSVINDGSWYTPAEPAKVRGRTFYAYDPGGRLIQANNWQDTWTYDQSTQSYFYVPAGLRGTTYAYDPQLKLRTSAQHTTGPTLSAVERTDSYTYDSQLDILTSETSNGTTTSWTYDAAGNRLTQNGATYTYDRLNRMLSSPGFSYENDILGNRLWRNHGQSGVMRTAWDDTNRMTSAVTTSSGARYIYRADGMRTEKIEGLTIAWQIDDPLTGSGHYDDYQAVNMPTTRYFYDGQMVAEEDYTTSGAITRTSYGLGARGVDMITKVLPGGQTDVAFPIYDGHGNLIAQARRAVDGQGNPYLTLGAVRLFDAWGNVRTGPPAGTPDQRYCASLGHRQDDESGLIYMRARFYEPTTGRFVSEDPAMDGWNWYAYCWSDPVNFSDETGRYRWHDGWVGDVGAFFASWSFVLTISAASLAAFKEYKLATATIMMAAVCASIALSGAEGLLGSDEAAMGIKLFEKFTSTAVLSTIAAVIAYGAGQGARNAVTFIATTAATAYSVAVLGALLLTMEP